MKVAVDLFRAEIMATLKTVGEYQLRMEQQLALLRETKDALLRADCEHWEEFNAQRSNHEWTFVHLFPRCFRYSFVIFLYSVIEAELISLCTEFSRRRKIPSLNLHGKKFCLERCKPFLFRTIGIESGKALAWNKLTVLEKVRNCISHAGGVIEDSKDKKFLKEATRAGIGIAISKHTISKGRLDIAPEFCKDSTDAAIEFFSAVFERGGFGSETAKVAR